MIIQWFGFDLQDIPVSSSSLDSTNDLSTLIEAAKRSKLQKKG